MTAGPQAGLADALQAGRSAVIDKLGREPVLWLAAAPLWTKDAAQDARFPLSDLIGFIEQACAAGWCETRGSLLDDEPGELLFWMPDEVRRDVLDILAGQLGPDLVRKAKSVARRVMAVSGQRRDRPSSAARLPGALLDWATLMTQPAPEQALVDEVRGAVEAGELGRAQQLVSAGETLAPLLSGTAELALARARRLMSLGVRRRNDHRALARYLDRPELYAAVAALRRPDTTQWALHLRGFGGVGKTMLIRDLASGDYAARQKIAAFPVARADFDHIRADYPVRRPVQLLLELSDELALHAAAITHADRALATFRAVATSAHERLSSSLEESGPVLDNPPVRRAVEAFAQVLESLSGVLLILDTCEELAKADAGIPDAPAVTATFAIIELLSELAPSMRVLLAGRRALPDHDYLAVTRVAGFTVDEATDYLDRFSRRPLAPGLVTAMIQQSAAVDEETGPGAMPSRISPFDLALYLSWAEEDPGLSEQRVLGGSNAYVQGRIIERLRDPLVRSALPVLAMIGRCRVDTLASLVPGGAEPTARLGARLAEQEWIDASGDPPRYVTPKPVLGLRLRRYFNGPERAAEYRATATRVAEVLTSRIGHSPLAEIEVDELLAALRLATPAAAAALWDGLADRAMEPPGHWGWMLNVTRRVLGESEDEQWPTADAIRATVLASHIAARRRASAAFSPREAWADVRARADHHPDPGMVPVLRARAAFGLLPYQPGEESLWEDVRRAPVDAPLAAAAADAADRLLEKGLIEHANHLFAESRQLASGLTGLAGPSIQAWVLVARFRLNAEDAISTVDAEAERLAKQTAAQPAWPDWVPPEDLLARVRIERGLLDPPGPAVLEEWEACARRDLRSIDRERLASLCLRIRLDRGTIEQAALDRWEERDTYLPSREPTCSAHDLVPPLCVTLAEAELAAGRPQRALALVGQRRDAALAARHEKGDDATLRALDEETVRIVRRYRIDGQRPLLTGLATVGYSSNAARLRLRDGARRTLAVVYHEYEGWTDLGAEVLRRPEGWHTWWQCLPALPVDPPSIRWPASGPGTGLAADIELDIEEARQLGGTELAGRFEQWFADWLARPRRAVPPVRSPDRYRDVRVSLRRAALAGTAFEPPATVPVRRLAELAFEEAELVAPRLPAAAARLFGRAYDAFSLADDQVGQLLAATSRTALTGDAHDLQTARASLMALRAGDRAAAESLSRPPQDGGPWSYWATRLRELGIAEGELSPDHSDALVSQVPTRLALRRLSPSVTGVLGLYAALAGVLLALTQSHVISLVIALFSFFGTIVGGGLFALASSVSPGFRRVVDGRGVGAFPFPLSALRFRAEISHDDEENSDRVLLTTDLGTPRGPIADFRGGTFLWIFFPLSIPWLYLFPFFRTMQRSLRRRQPPTGYAGQLVATSVESARVAWAGAPPQASDRWWRRTAGTTFGQISLGRAEMSLPWERILATSLSPKAAGRITWTRRLATTVEPFPKGSSKRVAVLAPPAWTRSLSEHYGTGADPSAEGAGSPVRIRHAMGRAVVTSAGPRLDVSGDVTETTGPRDLLDAEVLTRGQPSVIVLQAEPVTEAIDARLVDDLAEKLALAADLIEARTPAVLIIPAVPADLVGQVARIVARHAARRRGYDRSWLRFDLRTLLWDLDDPAVRDDLVLVVNSKGWSVE